MYASTRPWLVSRSARFSAVAAPFLRRKSIAFSMFPPEAASACLQSIIPAPVLSLSSFTCSAVISARTMSSLFFILLHSPGENFCSARLDFRVQPLKPRVSPLGTFKHCIGDHSGDHLDRFNGIVVGGDGVVDQRQIAIGVNDREDGDREPLCFLHGD